MTAAVTYGYGSRGEIAESKPDAVFESLPELAEFLEKKAPPNNCRMMDGI